MCSSDLLWLAVRANLSRLDDVVAWAGIVSGPMVPIIEDGAFTSAAAELLPHGDYNETTWSAFTEAVKAATGAKGKALFMPLRKALTGKEHGPEMGKMLPLIGRDKAYARLMGQG